MDPPADYEGIRRSNALDYFLGNGAVFSLNSSGNYDTIFQIGEQEEFLMADKQAGKISDGKPLIDKRAYQTTRGT